MANFVSLRDYIPDSEDDIEFIYADPSGTAKVGLWGIKDGATEATVQVVSGPGVATPAELRGTRVRVWSFTGLSVASRVQAFFGNRPCTGALEVRISGPGASVGDQNKALLAGSDIAERASIGGALVTAVPLEKSIGVNPSSPKMGTVRGLAVHLTGDSGAANSLKAFWERKGTSAHFAIGRSGDIFQYIAASIRSQAQGVGNTHFLSVELVGVSHPDGACQEMSASQMTTLRQLWNWVRSQHPVPNQMARAYSGMGKPLSTILTPLFRDMAKALSALPLSSGDSTSIQDCVESRGLSCHYWLDTGGADLKGVRPCPGLGVIGQLPQIIGSPRVRVNGDADFILP